jgi:hypothetical protein
MPITEPGVYDGIPEADYHADTVLAPELGRSLSQSGAKTLLTNPARFAWERQHGRPPKDAFDLGSLAHALILRNPDVRILVVDAYDWRTKAAQEQKKAAYAAGQIPVHRGDLLQASKIAAAVRRHPLAGAILSEGRPEVTLYWVDPETGVTCRARIDWLREGTSKDCIVDLKTAGYGRGTVDAFGRSAASFDYPMQAAHYSDGWRVLTGQDLPFLTITVEVDPPYFVTVGYYTPEDLAVGRERMRAALAEYAERESAGRWDEDPQIVPFELPGWYGRAS